MTPDRQVIKSPQSRMKVSIRIRLRHCLVRGRRIGKIDRSIDRFDPRLLDPEALLPSRLRHLSEGRRNHRHLPSCSWTGNLLARSARSTIISPSVRPSVDRGSRQKEGLASLERPFGIFIPREDILGSYLRTEKSRRCSPRSHRTERFASPTGVREKRTDRPFARIPFDASRSSLNLAERSGHRQVILEINTCLTPHRDVRGELRFTFVEGYFSSTLH